MDNDPQPRWIFWPNLADDILNSTRSATRALYPQARIPETPMPAGVALECAPMVTCDNCGGEGGFYSVTGSYSHAYADPTPGERWDECPTCDGLGWVEAP